jgi:hypothetical protein
VVRAGHGRPLGGGGRAQTRDRRTATWADDGTAGPAQRDGLIAPGAPYQGAVRSGGRPVVAASRPGRRLASVRELPGACERPGLFTAHDGAGAPRGLRLACRGVTAQANRPVVNGSKPATRVGAVVRHSYHEALAGNSDCSRAPAAWLPWCRCCRSYIRRPGPGADHPAWCRDRSRIAPARRCPPGVWLAGIVTLTA